MMRHCWCWRWGRSKKRLDRSLSYREFVATPAISAIVPRAHYPKLPKKACAAYREARRAVFRQSVARLQQASGAAVSTLLKVMIDPSTPPSTNVRAADSVLDHSAKAIELEDIEARLAERERFTEQSRRGRS